MKVEAPHPTHGFPPGYFVLRSDAPGERVLDVYQSKTEDGSLVALWPEKDGSLVEVRRNPGAENQVFFIDETGALCSRCSGHAIDVTEGNTQGRLVLRHRQPTAITGGRHLPQFSLDQTTGEISVNFSFENSLGSQYLPRKYVLVAMPLAKSRTILDDASDLITSAVSAPLNFLIGGHTSNATPEAVVGTDIDLGLDEVLPEERGEEAEVDDSPEPGRQVCVISVPQQDDPNMLLPTKLRRRWRALPLRMTDARTGAI